MSEYRRRSGGNRRGRFRRPSSESRSSHTAPKGFLGSITAWFSKLFKKKHTPSKYTPAHTNGAAKAPSTPRPEIVPTEVTSARLYVGNLSYDAVESDLFDLFSKEGVVRNVEIIMDKRTNRCKGFGFVEMDSLEVAKATSQKLNRTDFMGRQILVMGAKNERRDKETTTPAI
ncbi:MAG: hypothetical protein V4507_17110 [Verrucomicrobiota bacterium]